MKKKRIKIRNTWSDFVGGNAFNPVTKVIPNKKKEKSKRACRGEKDYGDGDN